jgi:hypothetical protein
MALAAQIIAFVAILLLLFRLFRSSRYQSEDLLVPKGPQGWPLVGNLPDVPSTHS